MQTKMETREMSKMVKRSFLLSHNSETAIAKSWAMHLQVSVSVAICLSTLKTSYEVQI
jgi:hypothetical protein